MLSVKKLLLGACGAAAIAAGAISTAHAHTVVGSTSDCTVYARQYASVNAPHFGLFGGWRRAHAYAYNQCLAGDAAMAPAAGVAGLVTAPVAAATNIAAGAVTTAGAIAGAALSVPAAVVGGLASPFKPAGTTRVEPAAAEPVVTKNYRGSFTEADLALIGGERTTTTALAVPAMTTVVRAPAMAATAAGLAMMAAPARGSSEWYSYCAAKYRSFDPATGTYLAFSGERRMCR
jgi:hypothetical protein